jgi:hypothetical protein
VESATVEIFVDDLNLPASTTDGHPARYAGGFEDIQGSIRGAGGTEVQNSNAKTGRRQ